jgi:hypothetical protein
MKFMRKTRPGTRLVLTGQLGAVRSVMMDGSWHSVRDISRCLGEYETSVSARMRDLRKRPYGGYEVERRWAPTYCTYQYRLRRVR